MARPLSELQGILKGLDGVQDAYIQPPSTLQYPCIMIERDNSDVSYADNIKYLFRKRYSVIVIDRNPESLIPDQVESLPNCSFDRFYKVDTLNHFAFVLYF